MKLAERRTSPFIADIIIVTAGSEDLADLVPLFDAYRAFFAGSHGAAESERFLAERLARKDSVVFLARSAVRAEGFIQLYPLWSSWYCRRIWFLSDLYVTEASRKRGLGRRLVESALAHARTTNASSVIVELPHREPHLKAFYARLGFHQDEVFDLARYRFEK
ncbi:MAG: GNAT family N-acetyltransferase [Candidatus Cybelea sp.]